MLSLHLPFDGLTQTSNIHAQHSLRGTETDIHDECLRQGSSSPMAICEGSHRTREQHRRYAVEGHSKPFDRKIEARLCPCQVILEARPKDQGMAVNQSTRTWQFDPSDRKIPSVEWMLDSRMNVTNSVCM